MGTETGHTAGEEKDRMSREERIARFKGLIQSQGEDAAKVLQMWLQQAQQGKSTKGK